MFELGRQRIAVAGQPAVHAPCVGLAHRLGAPVERRVVGLGDAGQAESAEERVLPGARHAHHLGPAPQRPAPVPLHLPDPVVGCHPALRRERGLGRRRLDMSDPPPIPPHRRPKRSRRCRPRGCAAALSRPSHDATLRPTCADSRSASRPWRPAAVRRDRTGLGPAFTT